MRPSHGGQFLRGLRYGLLLAIPLWVAVGLMAWAWLSR